MSRAENGCNGSCCERFHLPVSYEELKVNYQAWRRKQKQYDWNGERKNTTLDIFIIFPMVIPLNDGKPAKYGAATGEATEIETYHYTCKHFDKETRKCGIYDIRPHVCRDFPHGKPCQYEGCKFKVTT